MSKSLTEAAKAVLEGKTLEEGYGANYPSVGSGSVSNPNPVDPSTASTGNAKTLHPGTKAKEDRHGQNGAGSSDTGDFPLPQDLGGATPTSVATGNLGANAASKTGKDNTRSGQASVKGEPKKSLKSQPQSMAEDEVVDGEVVEEENALSIVERLRAIKEAKKCEKEDDESEKKDDDHDDKDDKKKMDEDFELSEELEDFINQGIEAGLSEEEIMEAIDENFEFISEEEELDEVSKDLVSRYAKSAYDDNRSRNFHRGRAAENPEWPHRDTKNAGKAQHKSVARSVGIKTAIDKLSGNARVNAKEEYELDENHYNAMEDYQIDMSEHVNALLEGEGLSEEFHDKATTIFEAAVRSKLEEEVALLEQAYAETLEERIAQIEEELTSQVDDYLNYVVEQWIEENEVAVESALRSELTEDFISGLRHLFAEHYIDVPEEEVQVVEELSSQVEDLEAKLNEEIQRNVELTSMLSESRKAELTAYVCEGLSNTQAAKLHSLAESVEYTSDDDFIEKVYTLKENYFPVAAKNDSVLDRAESADPSMINESTLEGPMGRYVQAIGKTKLI